MDYLEKARRVLDIEILELQRLRERLDENFSRAVELMKDRLEARNKIVVVGVGKSGHIGRKIASTLTSTGSPAVVLDSLDALHGDLGMVADGGIRRDHGQSVARSHDLVDAQKQAAADHSRRMVPGEILLLKTARFEQDHGEGVTESEHHGRARGRREIQRTGFLLDVHVENDVRVPGQV